MKKAKTTWISKCWDHHSQYICELDVAPDWGDWETDWNMCWCCGHRTPRLQKCHIIPKSLGGTNNPENIVPLCSQCHDKAPDVIDNKIMFEWIKEQQNPTSGLGLGRYWHVQSLIDDLVPDIIETYGEIDWEELIEIVKGNYSKTSAHCGQVGQGSMFKDGTREWIIKESLKDYKMLQDHMVSLYCEMKSEVG